MSKFWEIKNAASNESAELTLYGYIGEWDEINSQDVVRELKGINSPVINVKINSYGGSVFTAQAIFSSLVRHSATINVFIDGIAASAATIIAMAGDKIYIPSNAMMMIHNPALFGGGDSDDFREMADLLDKVRESIIAAYKRKVKLDDATIIELMDNETWMTADEAVAYGFADEVEPAVRVAASMNNGYLVVNNVKCEASRFKNIPANFTDKPEIKIEVPENNIDHEVVILDIEKLKSEYPALFETVFNSGVEKGAENERLRIKSIEDTAIPGHKELVSAAMYDKPITAEQLALQILNAEKGRNAAFLLNRQDDADELNDGTKNNSVLDEKSKLDKQKEATKNAIIRGFMKGKKKDK